MRTILKTGSVSVNKYGENHYDISVHNKLDGTISTVNFITKDELRKIKKQISDILKDGDV